MKKNKSVFLLLPVLFIFVFASCEQDLLESPTFKSRGSYSTGAIEPPSNVSATHGGYRAITLSWTAVKNASQYFIYSSSTATGTFQKITETSDSTCNITLSEIPDSLKYYKICSADYDGLVSPFSMTCSGSTLATPVITGITQNAGGDAVTVRWYKGSNCSENTYLTSDLIYTVVLYASDGKTVLREVSLSATEADVVSSSRYTFSKLTPNTEYYVQVKAHMKSSQNAAENSDILNQSTAHSLIPVAPEKLDICKGISRTSVDISWALPKFAEIKTGDAYASRPVYFRIYRKLKAQPDSAFSLLVSYLGTVAEDDKPDDDSVIKFSCESEGSATSTSVTVSPSADSDAETNENYKGYISKSLIKFSDKTAKPGEQYTYRIQSFIDDNGSKTTTSDESYSEDSGWLISGAVVSVSSVMDVDSDDKTKINSVNVSVAFKFDDLGVAYTYKVKEVCQEKDENDADFGEAKTLEHSGTSYSSFFPWTYKYIPLENGHYQYYKYSVSVCSADGSEEYFSVASPGSVIVINNNSKIPDVSSFEVADSYKDKFLLRWKYNETCSYTISWTNKDKDGTETDGNSIVVSAEELSEPDSDGFVSYAHAANSGDIRYQYTLTADNGFKASRILEGQYYTLGTPAPEFSGGSYDSITVYWSKVQKADSYSVKAYYAHSPSVSFAAEIISEPAEAADGRMFCKITQPDGFDDALISGKPVVFTLDAKNTATGDTTSSGISVCTLGPADTNLTVQGGARKSVSLKWNEAAGAGGYLIFRVKYSKDYTGSENKGDIYYFDSKNASLSLIGADSAVSASCTKTAGEYTFIDKYKAVEDVTDQYQTDQAQLSWGIPYGYTVIPVVSSTDYEFSDSLSVISKSAVQYQNLEQCEKKGATSGYGLNLSASKASTDINVQLSWKAPYGASSKPVIYYRAYDAQNGSGWKKYDVSNKDTSAECPPDVSYKAYDYLVCYNPEATVYVDPYYEIYLAENKTSLGEKKNKGYIFSFEPLGAKYAGTLSGSGYEKDSNYYSERVSWKNWDYTERACGPDSWYIEMFNANKDCGWVRLADIQTGKESQSLIGSVMSEADRAEYDLALKTDTSYTIQLSPASIDNGGGTTDGLLKVLRDAKHYYRIKGERTDTDEYGNTKSIYAECGSDYSTYGYRQITDEELVRAATLAMSVGMKATGAGWKVKAGGGTSTSEKSGVTVSSTGGIWKTNFVHTITFDNFAPELTTKAGTKSKFLSLSGKVTGETWEHLKVGGELYYPHEYINHDNTKITVSPCGDYGGFYNADIIFFWLGSDSEPRYTQQEGYKGIKITYPDTNEEKVFGNKTPLPFKGSDFKNDTEEWK